MVLFLKTYFFPRISYPDWESPIIPKALNLPGFHPGWVLSSELGTGAVSPAGAAQGCCHWWLYQMDRDIPSMLLVTVGYGNIKNNEKGRLRPKSLVKPGAFVKAFFFLNFFFLKEWNSLLLSRLLKLCDVFFFSFLFNAVFWAAESCMLGKTINDHFLTSAPTAHSGCKFLNVWWLLGSLQHHYVGWQEMRFQR